MDEKEIIRRISSIIRERERNECLIREVDSDVHTHTHIYKSEVNATINGVCNSYSLFLF